MLPVPALFGEVSRTLGRLPAAETLLARADRRTGTATELEATLLELFDLPVALSSPSVAALTFLADVGRLPDGWCLRADPVHLHADQDHLRLFGERLLQLTAAEADVLVAELNASYAADGWRFEAPVPGRWYLLLPTESDIATVPLPRAMGHDVRSRLPSGPDHVRWLRMLTEIQMLLHASQVNQQREQRGALTVNSVWLWGQGTVPASITSPWAQVWTNEPLAAGLARLSGRTCEPVPGGAEPVLGKLRGRALVVLEQARENALYGDQSAWELELKRLEQQWFEPLSRALRHGDLDELEWLPGDGCSYRLRRRHLRRWWRRRRPLPH